MLGLKMAADAAARSIVASPMNQGLSDAGLLDLLGECEDGPGERDETEVSGLEQARENQKGEKRRQLPPAVAERDPAGLAEDSPLQLERGESAGSCAAGGRFSVMWRLPLRSTPGRWHPGHEVHGHAQPVSQAGPDVKGRATAAARTLEPSIAYAQRPIDDASRSREVGDIQSRAQVGPGRAEDVAACPACRGRLAWESTRVRCDGCERVYPRAPTGAPILLLEVAPAARRHVVSRARSGSCRKRLAVSSSATARVLCPELTYRSPNRRGLVASYVASLPRAATIANVGSGARRYGPNVVNVDIEPIAGVDIVGTAEQLPLADASCDGAVLQAVLEHVRSAPTDPSRAASSAQAGRFALRRGAVHAGVPPESC